MPTLIGVFAWPNAVEIDEAPSATAPPAWMNCLRSMPFPLSEHPIGAVQCNTSSMPRVFGGVLHFEVARLHQHREPGAGGRGKGTGVVRRHRFVWRQLD